jgi:RND family efflux transporter MFP subunit
MSRQDLLKELSIRDDERDESSGAGKWIVLVVVLLLALGAGGWWWFNQSRQVEVQVATAVPAASVSGASGSVLDASGYVIARRQATVSAKTTGKVREVLIQEGMRVEAGQLLATLDDTNVDAQLELAEAQVNSARQRVAELKVQLSDAERQLVRQRELIARKLAAQQTVDTAQASVDGFKARIGTALAEITVAERSLAVFRQQLDDNQIRAPFAGVVIAKAAQPGEMISPISAGGGFTRTGIGTIVDMDSLEVEVDVGESFINRVLPDMPTEINLNAYPDWKIPGRVIAIIPTADRTKATVKVRVAIVDKDARILPDMGARVRFIAPTATSDVPKPVVKGVLIPAQAVRDGRIFVVRNGVVDFRTVRIAETRDGQVRIEEGLSPGESVVLNPPESLEAGTAVVVR